MPMCPMCREEMDYDAMMAHDSGKCCVAIPLGNGLFVFGSEKAATHLQGLLALLPTVAFTT